ncbi:hypothetical protein J8J19_24200, partial [Mycobacterium tuberculosis]|nr:hypothetical protein [Mycobacterium tuberculosis]
MARSSARQSSIIAANLCGWLQRTGYLRANPFLDDDALVLTVPAPSTPAGKPVTASEPDTALCASDMA